MAAALVIAVAITCLVAVELSLRTVRTARERGSPAGALAQGTVELASYVLLLSSLLIALAALPFLRSTLPDPAFALLILLGFFYLVTVSYVWAAHEWLRSRDGVDDERTTGGNWLVLVVFAVGYLSAAVWPGFALLVVAALGWLVFGSILAPDHVDRVRDAVERRAAESAEEEPVDPANVYGFTDEVERIRVRLERTAGRGPRPSRRSVRSPRRAGATGRRPASRRRPSPSRWRPRAHSYSSGSTQAARSARSSPVTPPSSGISRIDSTSRRSPRASRRVRSPVGRNRVRAQRWTANGLERNWSRS